MEDIVRKKLELAFVGGKILIDFNDGKHMAVEIIWPGFMNAPLLKQHQMVNQAVRDLLDSGELHALKIKTRNN